MKVGVLGSCRVDTPLLLASQRGELELVRSGVFGYIHSPREMIQAASLFLQKRPLPDARHFPLMALLNPKPIASGAAAGYFGAVDVVVVEISSVREMGVGELSLQINKVREHLATLPSGDLLVRALNRSDAEWRAAVADATEHADMDDADRKLLEGLSRSELTLDGAIADLSAFVESVNRPVLFVSHFLENYDGAAIPQRKVIREALEHVVACYPTTAFFDPTPHVAAAGRREVLKDLGHYKEEFEAVISQLLVAKLRNFTAPVSGNPRQPAS